MLQLTAERILPLTSIEDIYIVTNADYSELIAEQLPYVPKENILCEPVGGNTAPCIGMGAAYILKRNSDAVVLVLATGHLIKQEEEDFGIYCRGNYYDNYCILLDVPNCLWNEMFKAKERF